MSDEVSSEHVEYLQEATEGIFEELGSYEDRELKGFHRKISEDVRDLLIESNPTLELNNNPTLVLVLITSIHSKDPCSSCVENLSNVSEWSMTNDQFDNRLRVLMIDSINGFDDKKMWEKLKISFDDVPLTLFFDENLGLVDIVQGVMSVNYLNMFWSRVF